MRYARIPPSGERSSSTLTSADSAQKALGCPLPDVRGQRDSTSVDGIWTRAGAAFLAASDLTCATPRQRGHGDGGRDDEEYANVHDLGSFLSIGRKPRSAHSAESASGKPPEIRERTPEAPQVAATQITSRPMISEQSDARLGSWPRHAISSPVWWAESTNSASSADSSNALRGARRRRSSSRRCRRRQDRPRRSGVRRTRRTLDDPVRSMPPTDLDVDPARADQYGAAQHRRRRAGTPRNRDE